ncbi:MAG: hypothetical protein K5874_08075 [Bacteroidaceae bacterium]|nr:hypothetical protein [Bacteroidaceae bacterium]
MKRLALMITILSVLGCADSDHETNYLREFFKDQHITFPKELKHCVIIPEGGCSGCIASGMGFISSNDSAFSINQKENKVIFTKVNSLKLLKRNLRGVSIDSLYSLVDKDNRYNVDKDYNIYPIIIYLSNGEITSVGIQSPNTDAFGQLIKDL